jgi:hypothetical protein
LVPSRKATALGEALRYELLVRLRHSSGLIYSVVILTTQLDDDCCQLDFILDPVPANTAAALQASVTAVRDVAAEGFTNDAIQAAHHASQALFTWDDTAASDYLIQMAVNDLLGRATPTKQALLDDAASITGADLRAVLAASLGSLIVAVDANTKVRKADAVALELTLDSYDIWQRLKSSGDRKPQEPPEGQQEWQSKTSKAALTLTETHLLKLDSGKTKSIRLADIVLVGDRSCGCMCLMDRRGRSTEVHTDDWKNSKKLRRKLLNAFPAGIVRQFPEE